MICLHLSWEKETLKYSLRFLHKNPLFPAVNDKQWESKEKDIHLSLVIRLRVALAECKRTIRTSAVHPSRVIMVAHYRKWGLGSKLQSPDHQLQEMYIHPYGKHQCRLHKPGIGIHKWDSAKKKQAFCFQSQV